MSQPDLIVVNEKLQELELYQSFLAESTYQAQFFLNAQEALQKLSDIRPKVLILAKDLDSISCQDFMAEFSQYKSWENMRILISSDNEVEKSEFFGLASLGASDVYVMGNEKKEFLHKIEQLYSSDM